MASKENDGTKCSICNETFVHPQILPCLHTFCKTCIDEWQRKGSAALKCPKCRTGFRKDDVKPDFRLGEFLEVLSKRDKKEVASDRAEPDNASEGDKCELCEENVIAQWCQDCEQWMCGGCKKIHLRSKMARNHKFISIKGKKTIR